MGIRFFEKNKIDLTVTSIAITVTDPIATDAGQAFVNQLRDRRNDSGWSTTDSTDAALTEILVEFGDLLEINTLFLMQHNWKAYTVQYWNGAAYQNFPTPIAETVNALPDTIHQWTNVETTKCKIIIQGTFTPNDDKYATQIVFTQEIGEFTFQPKISDIRVGRNRKILKALSGKVKVMRSSGFTETKLDRKAVTDGADMDLIEKLHDYYNGFLVWLCGGNTAQFRNERIGYRKKDLMLMNISSEYAPEWNGGMYRNGIDVEFKLVEVI
jgi:hypothetical protein